MDEAKVNPNTINMLTNDFTELNSMGQKLRNSGASADTLHLYLQLLASIARDCDKAQKTT